MPIQAHIVAEVRPYRLIEDDYGRCAVVEARCGHVYCLHCDHPRHCAPDTPAGMVEVVGDHGWTDQDHAAALFRELVDREERYSQIIW
ncbi:MAG TPA: hypothetical protein VLL76_03225 [Candidatus Omnitrophota bacterium]|nr:hypothetical protein [Candidatus Omnitrophota bacterium]